MRWLTSLEIVQDRLILYLLYPEKKHYRRGLHIVPWDNFYEVSISLIPEKLQDTFIILLNISQITVHLDMRNSLLFMSNQLTEITPRLYTSRK